MVNKIKIGFDAVKTNKLIKENKNIYSDFGLSHTVKIPQIEQSLPGGPVLHYIQVDNGELRELLELYDSEISTLFDVELLDGLHIISYTNNDFYEWKVFLHINNKRVARVHNNIGSVKFRITRNMIIPVPQPLKSLIEKDVSRARLISSSIKQT